ncbi:MAG TPA: hypothetical protein DGG94_21680 [Micromonosporaceae bacterium]|nr:hypothetical protein [Micromonosporaceae bacterium]
MLSVIRRGIIGAGITAAMMSTLATPALGEPNSAIQLNFPDVLVPDVGPGIERMGSLRSEEVFTLRDVVITVDLSGLTEVADVTISGGSHGCSSTSTLITCTSDSISGSFTSFLPRLLFKAASGAENGATGKLLVTVKSSNHETLSDQATVTVGEGVDLAAPGHLELTGAPGSTLQVPAEVSNAGAKDAKGAVVSFFHGFWLDPTKQYSNCLYAEGKLRACVFDTTLIAGKTYRTHESIRLKLRSDARAPWYAMLETFWETPAEFEQSRADAGGWFGKPGSGEPLRLVEAPSAKALGAGQVDANPSNNWAGFTINVTGDSLPDFAAIGATGSGAAGSTVTVEIGIRNVGPATHYVEGDPYEGRSRLRVTVPEGSSLAQLPKGCSAVDGEGNPDPHPERLDAAYYECWGPEYIETGKSYTFPLSLRIDRVVADAAGEVEENWLEDSNPANDKAALVLNGTGGNGGGLPVTGAQVGAIVVSGALLLGAGVIMLVVTRRRRVDRLAN